MSLAALLAVDVLSLVVGFNVVAVLLWFLIGALRRGHRMRITRVRIAIEEIRKVHGDDAQLSEALDEVLEHLQKAEDLGPLKGREPLSAAHGAMAALVARAEAEAEAEAETEAEPEPEAETEAEAEAETEA